MKNIKILMWATIVLLCMASCGSTFNGVNFGIDQDAMKMGIDQKRYEQRQQQLQQQQIQRYQ